MTFDNFHSNIAISARNLLWQRQNTEKSNVRLHVINDMKYRLLYPRDKLYQHRIHNLFAMLFNKDFNWAHAADANQSVLRHRVNRMKYFPISKKKRLIASRQIQHKFIRNKQQTEF